jgi:hypothetical protein
MAEFVELPRSPGGQDYCEFHCLAQSVNIGRFRQEMRKEYEAAMIWKWPFRTQ